MSLVTQLRYGVTPLGVADARCPIQRSRPVEGSIRERRVPGALRIGPTHVPIGSRSGPRGDPTPRHADDARKTHSPDRRRRSEAQRRSATLRSSKPQVRGANNAPYGHRKLSLAHDLYRSDPAAASWRIRASRSTRSSLSRWVSPRVRRSSSRRTGRSTSKRSPPRQRQLREPSQIRWVGRFAVPSPAR